MLLKFVNVGPVDNKLTLVQMMAWQQIGDKPMMAQFTDTNIYHPGWMG